MNVAWPLELVVAEAGEIDDPPEGFPDREAIAPVTAAPDPSLTVTMTVAVAPTEAVAVAPPLTSKVVPAGSGAVASIYSFNLATMAFELPL